jgi:membrane protease YdiL (CAAX protease family)
MSMPPDDDSDEQDGEAGGGALDDRSTRNLVVGLAIAVEGGLVGTAWLVGWLLEVNALARLTYDLGAAGWGLLATLPMLAGFFLAVRYPVGPLRSIKRFSDETLRPLLTACGVIDLLGISVLPGFGEELLFRGVVQEAFWLGLREPLGGPAALAVGVTVSACLFGLLHAVTPSYAVLAAVMGAYLGLVFYLSGNLLAVIVAHALYDFVALLWLTHGPAGPSSAEEQQQADDAPPP